MKKSEHTKIYKRIALELERSPLTRRGLIEKCLGGLGLTKDELSDRRVGSRQNILRSSVGEVINEMQAEGLIGIDRSGRYYLISERPVLVRIERCESEILKALSGGTLSKGEIKDRLVKAIGTDKTATRRDDDLVSTYMGHILKRLVERGAVVVSDAGYSLSERVSAKSGDINALLALKTEFIAKIHSRGGEFFENYFMTLLGKYLEKHGKKVTECYVTGGSADGGIDGVAKTVDSLGFRETIMVQTKNRVELSGETDVRGFYGAVCAKQGSRGIFVNSSDFHETAKEFLDSIDNCVGLNGERIFAMAIECSYGIKKVGGRLTVDERIV